MAAPSSSARGRMVPVNLRRDSGDVGAHDPLPFTIRCGLAELELSIRCHLEALGYRPASTGMLLLFDLPCGFAFQALTQPERGHPPVIVVTANTCPEYWEDLWDLRVAGLIVGIHSDRQLEDAIARVARGERYWPIPEPATQLTASERAMLR